MLNLKFKHSAGRGRPSAADIHLETEVEYSSPPVTTNLWMPPTTQRLLVKGIVELKWAKGSTSKPETVLAGAVKQARDYGAALFVDSSANEDDDDVDMGRLPLLATKEVIVAVYIDEVGEEAVDVIDNGGGGIADLRLMASLPPLRPRIIVHSKKEEFQKPLQPAVAVAYNRSTRSKTQRRSKSACRPSVTDQQQ